MKKIKLTLESLEITTFETTAAERDARGTVEGQAKPTNYYTCPCGATDPNRDCTYGCSRESACPDNCILYRDDVC